MQSYNCNAYYINHGDVHKMESVLFTYMWAIAVASIPVLFCSYLYSLLSNYLHMA